jgi:hypothetical protein
VLEVNASAARTGRHVLQLVSEATQSHQLTATSLGIGDVSAPAFVVDSTSLVLFEEIDVRSADDHGLFSAIQSLMMTTKRPIILTCNGRQEFLFVIVQEHIIETCLLFLWLFVCRC